jgi:hypothetical protein
VEEAAQAVVTVDLADPGRRTVGECPGGGCLAQAAVWPMMIVVALVLAQRGCGVSLVDDQETVEEFARMVPTKRSAMAFARGALTGVLRIWLSMAAVNLLSRSRMGNRKCR